MYNEWLSLLRRLMRLGFYPVLVFLVLTALACGGQSAVETQDVVATVPWPDQERLTYRFTLGDQEGTALLTVDRRSDQYELRVRFKAGEHLDESLIVVDAQTLRPARSERTITSTGQTVTAEYDAAEGIVQITVQEDGDERSRPLRLEEHYYDNESSFFLWRTVPLREGYEASYYSVLPNRGANALTTVRVVGRETVTVPAGTFDAWRIEIDAPAGKPVAWVDSATRQLVRFENEEIDLVLELTDAGPGT